MKSDDIDSLEIPFGEKHRGRTIAELFEAGEIGYLCWALSSAAICAHNAAVHQEIWRRMSLYHAQGGAPPSIWRDRAGRLHWRTATSYPGSPFNELPAAIGPWQEEAQQIVEFFGDRIPTDALVSSLAASSLGSPVRRRREHAKRVVAAMLRRGVLVEDDGAVTLARLAPAPASAIS